MKKRYSMPQAMILALSQRNMLMASPPTIKVNNDPTDEEVTTGQVLSRRHNSVWDDEEEDEEF